MPDSTSLSRLDATLRGAGIPIDGIAGEEGSIRVDYQASATPTQRTQGASIVAGFDWSAGADATYIAKQSKTAATTGVDNGNLQAGSDLQRMVYCLAIVAMNEINILRAAIPHRIVSITRATTTATVVTELAHGLSAGNAIAIHGADVVGYNLTTTVASVVNATTFTYTMANAGVSPAVGSLSYTLGAVPLMTARTPAQIVNAVKAQIALTGE